MPPGRFSNSGTPGAPLRCNVGAARRSEHCGVNSAANIAAQATAVWEIPLALVLMAIMNRIYRMQVEHRRPPCLDLR